MRTFDPPSPVPNPWEDLGSWVPIDEQEEEDYGGEEESTTRMTRTTRSSSLFGACCQRGVNLVDGSPYLFIFIYLVTIYVIELVDM
jgi:hypothetical protein